MCRVPIIDKRVNLRPFGTLTRHLRQMPDGFWYSDLSPVSLNMTFAPRNYLLLLAATSVSTLSTSQQEIYYHTEITNARGIFIILFSYFGFVVGVEDDF